MSEWKPFREPVRVTLTRTVGIAVIAGGLVALWGGGLRRWPIISFVMLWPALGGHWIDLFFLNVLRPHLPESRTLLRTARLAIWFGGGILLATGARLTAGAFSGHPRLAWLTWGYAGAAFVGIELIAHAGLHRRGRPSFYNGLG